MDYTGWKWWKHQELQLDDIKIEVIDIWHFALSDLMVHYDLNTCINEIYNNFKKIFDEITIFDINKVRELTETFTYWTLRNNRFNIVPFVKLCLALNVSFEEIYKLYMGKNILNKFRQNNGYKTGNYKKIWDGQEDNVYLTIILKETEISNINFDIIVYDKLTEKYQSV
jgi:dimeric dUTPase (all-alpha-NTP-PPase superfamily)